MSVVGFDVGNDSSCVAIARKVRPMGGVTGSGRGVAGVVHAAATRRGCFAKAGAFGWLGVQGAQALAGSAVYAVQSLFAVLHRASMPVCVSTHTHTPAVADSERP
jgi:hypothetical protein